MRSPTLARPGEKFDPRNSRHIYIDPKSRAGRQIREICHGLGSTSDMARLRNMITKYLSCPSGGKALQDWAAKHATGNGKADRAKLEWFQNYLMLARRFFQWIQGIDPAATLFADAATHRAIQTARMQISHPVVNQAVRFYPEFKKHMEDAERAEALARETQKAIALKLQGRRYANRDTVDAWVRSRQAHVESLSQQAFITRRHIERAYTGANLKGFHGERGVKILADVDLKMWRLQQEVKTTLKAHAATFRDLKKKYEAARTRQLAGHLMFQTGLYAEGLIDRAKLKQGDKISYWATRQMMKLETELKAIQNTIRTTAAVAKLKMRQARQHIIDNQGVPLFERFGNLADPANRIAADRAAQRLYNLYFRPQTVVEHVRKEGGGYDAMVKEIAIPRDAFGSVYLDIGTRLSIEEHVEKVLGPKQRMAVTRAGENLYEDFRDESRTQYLEGQPTYILDAAGRERAGYRAVIHDSGSRPLKHPEDAGDLGPTGFGFSRIGRPAAPSRTITVTGLEYESQRGRLAKDVRPRIVTGRDRGIQFVRSGRTWKMVRTSWNISTRIDSAGQVREDARRRLVAEDDIRRRDIVYGTEKKRQSFYRALGFRGSPARLAYLDKILSAEAGKARSTAFYSFGKAGMDEPGAQQSVEIAGKLYSYYAGRVDRIGGKMGLARASLLAKGIRETFRPQEGRADSLIHGLEADLARKVDALAGKGIFGTLPAAGDEHSPEGRKQVVAYLSSLIKNQKSLESITGDEPGLGFAEAPAAIREFRLRKKMDRAERMETLEEAIDQLVTLSERPDEETDAEADMGRSPRSTVTGRLRPSGWVPNRPDQEVAPGSEVERGLGVVIRRYSSDAVSASGTYGEEAIPKEFFEKEDQQTAAEYTGAVIDEIRKSKRNRYRPS